MRTVAERIEALYVPEPMSGCWLWIGCVDRKGYGQMRYGTTRHASAHRVSYELERGPIAPGLTIDHLCRNHACVNPSHLEAVTMRVNLLRGVGFTAVNAAKTTCPRGHLYSGVRSNGDRRCLPCDNEHRRLRESRGLPDAPEKEKG